MPRSLLIILVSVLCLFISCTEKNDLPDTSFNLSSIMPNEEDFAGEPIHVKLSQKIEANSFQRLSDLTLSSTPSKKVKVITEYLEKLKKLNFQKSLTHVFNEQINNVTFSIVYYQFETESNAVAATDVLIEMLSESMDQNFKYMTKEKPFGANQKIMYTSYMTYQVFVGLYTRNNILCLTFVPYKSVFPRVIPVSTKKFKYDERYESYSGLPAFARLDNDKIIKLIKEIESNAKIDSSEKSKKFEVLFKLVLDFHKSNSENNERIVNTFLDQCQRKNLDEALRYVDLRITRDLSSQLLPSWYATKIEKVFGSSCEINLDPNSAAAHIQNNFSYDNIFGDKKPFLGLVEVKGILSGTKKAGDVKIIFSLFGDYVKLVDFKFN